MQAALAQMEQRKGAVALEIESAQQQQEEKKQLAKKNRRALEEAREEADAIRNMIQGHSLKLEGRRKRAEESQARQMELTMEQNNLLSRIHLLSEMEKEYEGFQKAVRLIMQAAEKNTLRGVHGPVANLIRTEKQHAVAIEIALGAGLQNIVVDREEDSKAGIQYLKQRDGGRATFLPMSAIRGGRLQEQGVENEFGFVGVAADLLQYDEKYRNVMEYLLGRTVVVEDLDCGIAMARKYQQRFRIVTLDGQVINRGGSMTGGSVSKSAGILSRANELAELQKRRETLTGQLEKAQKTAEETKRELDRANYELEVASNQQRQAEDAVLQLQGEKNQYDALLAAIEENLTALLQEQEDLKQRMEENDRHSRQMQQELERQEAAAEQCRLQLQQQQSGRSDLEQRSNALSQKISACKEEMAALQAKKQAVLSAVEDLKVLQRDMLQDQQGRQQRLEEYEQAVAMVQKQLKESEEKIRQLQEKSEEYKQQLRGLAEAKLQIEAERTAHDKRSREVNENLLNVERNAAKLEQKRATQAMEEKQLLDRLWENYELNYSSAQEQRKELESLPKANRRIGELKREINALGTVNVGAIEDFDRVNTRYTYLSTQRDDVTRSKEELMGIIEEITKEMTEIFAQQFQVIRESFQTTFEELFGGGKATLELEDPSDILNCGIEIKAQPPGKTLKTLTLLSGGEKAFVAIALYFAILKVHPTPFCVMDEIEAALDEANVIRFAKYMRSIAGKTQFIVITHRRGTMEEADVLYGVTMQEQGVSRILTLGLTDMVKQLRLKE